MLSFSAMKLTFAALVLVSQSAAVSAASSSCVPSSCAIGQYPPAAGVALVCGSDGVTYSSLCELELAACSQPELKLASQGVCSTKCDQECDAHESLICGSDGVTYQNACEFDRAYCKDKTLTPLGYGACTKSSRSLRDAKPKYVEGSIV
ncbi:Protease inhibitor epi11 [Globisporangium polare]